MQNNINYQYVSSKQMRQIDNITSSKYKINSLILMENAGKAVYNELEKRIKNIKNKTIAVICGSGNNAGDGFVVARYLHNAGYNVKVVLVKPTSSFKDDCKINFEILKKIKADISKDINEIDSDIIIDAILGTGIKGFVDDKVSKAIDKINETKAYKLSIDIPSGLDSDTGEICGNAVMADITITLALPKNAFKNKKTKRYTGELIIADIGIPKLAIEDILK